MVPSKVGSRADTSSNWPKNVTNGLSLATTLLPNATSVRSLVTPNHLMRHPDSTYLKGNIDFPRRLDMEELWKCVCLEQPFFHTGPGRIREASHTPASRTCHLARLQKHQWAARRGDCFPKGAQVSKELLHTFSIQHLVISAWMHQ